MSKHVAVLMGGWSNERPVSLASGRECAAALRRAGYQVTEVDVGRDIASVLSELKPDVAFNALHGPFGESGMMQGVLELLGIPYTHSGVLASALAMDKHQAKIAMKAAGVPVTDHVIVSRAEAGRAHVMPPPYVIKPIADGSSFGVFIVKGDTSHPPQEILREDWNSGEELMVERYIPGRELTCSVMGDVALGVTEIVIPQGFYNYEAKYAKGGSTHIIPAQLQPKIYDKVQKLSLAAHAALGCRGVTRCDFRYNDAAGEDGELVCLEINTQPGMTETSLVPEQAVHAGHSFEELVAWMVEDASCNR
ncbi:D-alanine--D-alanine ligase [Devosia sp. J2-20]|jgi:D-alanine-D-alanine ligase|uniref:D-alanine--D-alanine ligase n=1 Tax=Devosia litorisediminis TaxID=2829817 RepID=A0A942E413_9HYPH|nr:MULTISPECIES: D-alanine--D-alanine ligase [Devosia]MBS3847803.1 D-alanine--D-alanine ligase [Devosia litorisediminis]MCZ4345780.1 D-alanine--D-alanine ligase [Devosia neptuniae]WDQ99084.1 D-alanine--D-alanine ligase [Devosia sp. J2-20]|tara:strand:- start:7181 stop:8101 length:921 start_codon:yes stop_codon:yes gene_type:complete